MLDFAPRISGDTKLITKSFSPALHNGSWSASMELSTARANEASDRSMLQLSTVVAANHQCRPRQRTCYARHTIISRQPSAEFVVPTTQVSPMSSSLQHWMISDVRELTVS
jgi:hypothetical protein